MERVRERVRQGGGGGGRGERGVLRMDGEEIQHEFIYVDEAGFNLTRTRRRGRNIIGHRAIAEVPLIQAMEEACDQMELEELRRSTSRYLKQPLRSLELQVRAAASRPHTLTYGLGLPQQT
ncbi:unnamed protein product [Pleuronectes platessa]|uniref:Uncharacterized protein n=1 Tax=Pleuronectes platessa TaxID=8262 RepID=A0A9N7V446_PLEPL|nr:unnamed protein product [Pleuronectes platessa]